MGQLTVDRLGASHPLAVLDPVTREARLEQRAQRILAAFRVMGGSLGVLLTLLDDTHPPLELTLELVLMGGYAVTGVVLLGLLRRPYELDDVRAQVLDSRDVRHGGCHRCFHGGFDNLGEAACICGGNWSGR